MLPDKILIPVKYKEQYPGKWMVFDIYGNPLFGPFPTKQDAIDMVRATPLSFRNKHSEDIN